MKVHFKSTEIDSKKKTCHLVFCDKKKNSSKLDSLPDMEFGESLFLHSHEQLPKGVSALVLAVDSKAELTLEYFRTLGGTFAKTSKSLRQKNLSLDVSAFEFFKSSENSKQEKAASFLEGALLFNYSMQEGKSKPKKGNLLDTLTVHHNCCSAGETKTLKALVKEAQAISESVHYARRLGDLPGNMMTPTLMAQNASKLKNSELKVSVWDKARIKKEKMGGLLSVAAGSAEDPRFIIMEYKGKGHKAKKPTVLVGKGLTFDAGGISIKPSNKMDEMRYDMCGGAAVIGAMKLISEMKLPVHVIGLVPSTENLLGAAAIKPGDIFTARNGKTVEVLNTDAEGRLILADALSYASELDPKEVLSMATLTGAMVVALGHSHTGFFTRNDKLADKVHSAGKASGEDLWRMPLCDSHAESMKGRFADISNMSSTRGAGSAKAAAFLENFCEKSIPYAHFDIAGTAWNAGNLKSYHGSNGATGVLVRTLYRFVKGS